MAYLPWKYKRKYFKPRQKKAYTMLGLTLLSLIIFGGFAIRPAVITIVELKRKIQEQEKVLEKMDRKIKNLSLAQNNLRKVRSDLELIKEALPKNGNTPALLENSYRRARAEELRIDYANFEREISRPEKTPNGTIALKTIPFSFEIRGSFPQFIKFLEGYQDSLRQKNVQFINIRSSDGGRERYRIKSEAFFYKNE